MFIIVSKYFNTLKVRDVVTGLLVLIIVNSVLGLTTFSHLLWQQQNTSEQV